MGACMLANSLMSDEWVSRHAVKHTVIYILFGSGSVGGDRWTGSRGEEEDSGVPGNHTKDVLPAPHPHTLLPGSSPGHLQDWTHKVFRSHSVFSRLPLLLSEHRPAVLGVADDQFRREPAFPQLQTGLQWTLQVCLSERRSAPDLKQPNRTPS